MLQCTPTQHNKKKRKLKQKKKINKEIKNLNYMSDKMDLTDLLRTFHSTLEYTFSASAHETFSKIHINPQKILN
jgi:hypothetical protein